MQPPRRPRKTSVGVVGVLLRAVLVVGLVAMVGWPEWHKRDHRDIWQHPSLPEHDLLATHGVGLTRAWTRVTWRAAWREYARDWYGRDARIAFHRWEERQYPEGRFAVWRALCRDASLAVILPSGD